MSFLKLESLELTNIRCYEHINLEFNNGTNVITGENGSGKSTLLISIGFALYGVKYLTNMGIMQGDLIRRGETDGEINLCFTTDQGTFESKYILNYNGNHKWNVRKRRGAILTSTINESRIMIENLIGKEIDANVFKNALCSAQGELTILLEAAPNERKKQLHKILGIEEFDRTEKHVSRILSAIQDRRNNLADKLKYKEDDLEDIEQLKKIKKEMENSLKENQEQHSNITKGLDTLDQGISELQDYLNEIQRTKKIISEKSIKVNTNKDKKITLQKNLKEILSSNKFELNTEREFKDYKNELSSEENSVRKKLLDLKAIGSKYLTLNENLEKQVQLEKLMKKRLNELTDRLNSELGKDTLESLKTQLKREEKLLLEQRNNYNSQIKRRDELAKLITSSKKDLDSIVNKIESFEDEVNKFSITIKEIQIKIGGLESEIEMLEKEKSECETELNQAISKHGELKSSAKLHKETVELLEQVHEDSICPTCMQQLVNLDHNQLINEHYQSLKKNNKLLNKNEKLINALKSKIGKFNIAIKNIETNKSTLKALEKRLPEREENIKQRISLKRRYGVYLAELEAIETSHGNNFNEALGEKEKLLSKQSTRIIAIEKIMHKRQTEEEKLKQTEITKLEFSNEIKKIDYDTIKKQEQELQSSQNIYSQKITLIDDVILPKIRDRDLAERLILEIEEELIALNHSLKFAEKNFDQEKFNRLKDRRDDLLERRGSLLQSINNLTKKEIPELLWKIDKMENLERELNQIKTDLNQINSALPKAIKIKEVLSHLPSQIMQKITGVVSAQLTQTMKRMLPNRGFDRVTFDEEGEVKVSYNGNEIDRNTLSGGEKTVLGIGLRLSLAEYVAPLKFMILDEPTVHLDNERVDEFVEIIDRDDLFTDVGGQLLLVTHREEFNRNATRTIRISVKNNGSRNIIIDENTK